MCNSWPINLNRYEIKTNPSQKNLETSITALTGILAGDITQFALFDHNPEFYTSKDIITSR